MCGNLFTTTQMTQMNIPKYIMQIKLVITICYKWHKKGLYLHVSLYIS